MIRLVFSTGIRRSGAPRRGRLSLATRALLGAALLCSLAAAAPTPRRPTAPAARASDGPETKGARAASQSAQSGWLYVLDSKNGATEGQVLVLDPAQGSVVRSFATGLAPDFALSPDGKRLYIASTYTQRTDPAAREELSVIDTASGQIIQTVSNADRAFYNVQPIFSGMTLSPDGRWLYVSKMALVGQDNILYWVATLDTRTNKFLPEKAEVPNCGVTQFLPMTKARQLQVVCTDTMDVRTLKIMPNGASASLSTKLKGVGRRLRSDLPAYSFPTAEGSNMTMTADGRLLKIDSAQVATELLSIDVPSDRWVQTGVTSPDKGRVYVSLTVPAAANQGRWLADRITALDLRGMNRLGVVETSHPFSYLAVSRDGRFLYATDTGGASLMVIDTSTLREARVISNVGVSPSLVLIAP